MLATVLFLLAEALCTLVPLLVLLWVTKRFPRSPKARVEFLLFLIYLVGVFHVTGSGTIYDGLRLGLSPNVNLIPFSQDIDFFGYSLNVIMLIPFGFFVPRLWQQARDLGPAVLAGLGLIVLVELSQLLNLRATDIDDVICNLAGVFIGFALSYLGSREPEEGMLPLALVLLVVFFSRFFLFHEFQWAMLLY